MNGLRALRKDPRPGNRPMTDEQRARAQGAKTLCIPCLVWAMAGRMPVEHVARCCDYNHTKSGNIREGHERGYGCCGWHHRALVPDGWTHESMRAEFGPSLMDGSRLFERTYGAKDELIEIQNYVLANLPEGAPA